MFNSLSTYLASQSIKTKLRLSSIANAAALVIMIGCVAIGGKIAMNLRAERMAISEATVASAKLDKFAGRARLAHHAALDGDTKALGEAKWALGKARGQLATVRQLTGQVGLDFEDDIVSLQKQIGSFGSALASSSPSRNETANAILLGESVSDGAGTLDAALETAALEADKTSRQRITVLFGMFFAIFVLGMVVTLASARFLARDIIRSLSSITDAAREFASGTRNIDVPGLDRGDEIGDLARAFGMARDGAIQLDAMLAERAALRGQRAEEMKQLASHFEASIGDIVGGVAAASSQLQATASAMAAAAEQASSQSGLVAMSMDRASSGVTAAAAASDEFAMSIGEISRQATSSAELARRATDAATRADATISALDASANQVGQIVELISSIAQRTNLLALNASIEAARGGEAGRGFAVVASEVKELAAQTSRATDEIAAQIRAMQDSTGASVTALRSIGDQIKSLETTAISIASAVDQQSVAGQDLARSIDLAARSSDEVAANIGQVREASNSTGAAASQVLTSATELEGQASSLRHKVNDFLAHVRAS